MPTAGGQARSPAEQFLELIANKDLYEVRIREHERVKLEAEAALAALGQREAEVGNIQQALTEREKAVARREALVDDREQALAREQETDKARRARCRQLLPQIAELVK